MEVKKSASEIDLIGDGLLNAAHFELLWLMWISVNEDAIKSRVAKGIEILDSGWKAQRANVY